MAESMRLIRVLKTLFLVYLYTQTGLGGNCDISVLVFKEFICYVLAPLNIAVHYFQNGEIGTASGYLKGSGVCHGAGRIMRRKGNIICLGNSGDLF